MIFTKKQTIQWTLVALSCLSISPLLPSEPKRQSRHKMSCLHLAVAALGLSCIMANATSTQQLAIKFPPVDSVPCQNVYPEIVRPGESCLVFSTPNHPGICPKNPEDLALLPEYLIAKDNAQAIDPSITGHTVYKLKNGDNRWTERIVFRLKSSGSLFDMDRHFLCRGLQLLKRRLTNDGDSL